LYLLACLFSVPASAADIPFFLPYPKIDTGRWQISNGWSNGSYMSCEWRADAVTVHDDNLLLTLSDRGDKLRPYACPEIHTKSTSGYGTYSARIRTAAGSGLNTTFFTYVGPGVGAAIHDEIDFEFLGKDTHSVQLNYYVDGKPQDGTIIQLDFDASAAFHDYSFTWETSKIRWYVDGKLVHETKENSPLPSHPGRIYLSLWSGSKEEDDWLGKFTYTAPISAEFSSVKYTPLP
jgi:endo-1,3-1,4-beta-glycanase ExoK